jgi:hypothetical protein
MKLGVQRGVLAMYSLACEHMNVGAAGLGTHARALYMSGGNAQQPLESTPWGA